MPPRRPVLRRVLVVVAIVVVLTVAAAAVAATVVVRRPLPLASGEITLPGLGSAVTVRRDGLGVPHIYAEDAQDLFRAQGYVHAQDRFFEMDYRRHVTAGRLAELVGDQTEAIQADKVVRTLGWRRVAEQEWELLDARTQGYLQAYAEGVNTYLEGRATTSIAMEYSVLGLQVSVGSPEPWDPVDSLAWLKAMAWDLRSNYDQELARVIALGSLQDLGRVGQLYPAYPAGEHLPILDAAAASDSGTPASADVPATAAAGIAPASVSEAEPTPVRLGSPDLQAAVEAAERALEAVPQLVADGEGTGSNSWAVSGEHTASGLPMLANDPHLALSAPGVWTQVGLHCARVSEECPFQVSGFSFSGFPGVIIGHNDALAWGLTNMGADVTDFFVERVRDDEYQRDGEWRSVDSRTETIRVAGGDDLTLEVRSTEHGPIVSDVLTDTARAAALPRGEGDPSGGFEVALGWTALTPGRTAEAIFALNRARDAQDVAEAAAVFEVPAQNIVFATVDGDIGYQAPGRIPLRAAVPDSPVPSDGSWPRPGWDSRYDWQGYLPPEQLPRGLNPPEGFIVAANQAVSSAGVGSSLTADWDYGYRSQRIRDRLTELIDDGGRLDVEDMTALQVDDWSPYAAALVPVLLEQNLSDGFAAEGQELLRDWDFTQSADSAAAAYFSAVWAQLLELTFADEFPHTIYPDGGSRWLEIVRALLEQPTSPWWDDRTTVNVVENRDEILRQALVQARRELTVRLGKNPGEWQWGRLHTLSLQHPVLGGDGVPGPVRALVNPRPVGVGGGSSIVNATAWDAASGSFAVTAGPSMRMVVDLGDLDASRWVTVSGVSGHPGSAHYADQLGTWARGETYPWAFTEEAVRRSTADELTLRPLR